MATNPTVRLATAADVPGMARALAHAFHDDPVMAWLFGDDETRTVPYMERFFAHEGRRHVGHLHVYTHEAYAGAAYWDPPRTWKTRPRDMLGMAPFMVRAMRHRIPRALRGLGLIEGAHDRQDPDHYYLAVLGTEPAHQGSGIGSALIAPILDRCDADGTGAYLESSKEENIPFYRRHGFEVVEELALPGGPGLWPMWRDPQVPEATPDR